MRFPVPLVPARLVRRYKRFLADLLLEDGTPVTAHVANSGAMTGLTAPGARAWLRPAAGPGRKLAYSWEVVEADFGAGPEPVGVNTMHPNGLVAEAIRDGLIPALSGYGSLRREVRYGVNSRIDLLLEQEGRAPCYVEVKNVHLMRQPGRAEFPDCVTARGAKHLVELAAMRAAGARAVMVYLSQIGSAAAISLARDIDPAYGRAFDAAFVAGVEAIGLVCTVSPEAIRVRGDIPMHG